MGACAGDYDNDGLIDLYVTGVGSNQLYRNAGRGRFAEVPNGGGASPGLWSTSCAFVDVDPDFARRQPRRRHIPGVVVRQSAARLGVFLSQHIRHRRANSSRASDGRENPR